jgi:hypothetical protein
MNQVERQFNFDLQRFNDVPAATETDSNIDYSAYSDAHPSEQLDLLKKHGFYGESEQKETEQPQTEIPETATTSEQPETDSQEQEPEYEIKVEGESKKLPLSKLIELAQKGEDYTKKTQALSSERKELEQIKYELQQLKAQPQQQTNKAAEYEAIHKQALTAAMQELGITDPNEFVPDPAGIVGDPLHHAVYMKCFNMVSQDNYQRQAIQNYVQNTKAQIKQNPDIMTTFDDAMYGLLKADNRQRFAQVFESRSRLLAGNPTVQDIQLVEEHFNQAMTAKNAPKPQVVQQPKKQPLKTESPGATTETKQPTVNFKQIGKLKPQDQLQTLREAGYLRRSDT